MTKTILAQPTILLGRHVTGSYRLDADLYTFDGIVEAVVIPARPDSPHHVEFYVGDEYISLCDCVDLNYGRTA